MSHLRTVLDSIFDVSNAVLLSADEQADLIQKARASDDDAFLRLASSHAKILCKHRSRAAKVMPMDEAESLILEAVTTAIYTHDYVGFPGTLAATVSRKVTDAVSESFAALHGIEVPARHHRRYAALLMASGNDAAEAYRRAGTSEVPDMSQEGFAAIHQAVSTTLFDNGGSDASVQETPVQPIGTPSRGKGRPFEEDEDRLADDQLAVQIAFAAVNDDEERAIRLLFGFLSIQDDDLGFNQVRGDVPTQEMVADLMGLKQHKISRLRSSGLSKMRTALDNADLNN